MEKEEKIEKTKNERRETEKENTLSNKGGGRRKRKNMNEKEIKANGHWRIERQREQKREGHI
jgi:hypothetical protein